MPGHPTIWMIVGQGPVALAVSVGGRLFGFFFTLLYHFSHLSPSLWETAQYRMKYCFKGPLNPKQQQPNEMSLNIRKGAVFLQFVKSQLTYIHYSLSKPSLDTTILNTDLGFVIIKI